MIIDAISNIGSDGTDYVIGPCANYRLDKFGMRNGGAWEIRRDHAHNTTTVYRFVWSGGVPKGFEKIKTYKDEIIDESEFERVLTELGVPYV